MDKQQLVVGVVGLLTLLVFAYTAGVWTGAALGYTAAQYITVGAIAFPFVSAKYLNWRMKKKLHRHE